MSTTSRPRLIFLAHTPSPNTRQLATAAEVAIGKQSHATLTIKPPLEASADDVLGCDGILIGTTENIGYMAGATKDFFDRSYNDLLETARGKPVAIYIRAGLDGTGSKKALASIVSGLGWRLVADILVCRGEWRDDFAGEVEDLALTLALTLEMEM
ncbi:MAG: flavodoxin family protein [Proteobacteria bacterium]|nr:flavodoxin family protein [Pseudomonadota bacterium]